MGATRRLHGTPLQERRLFRQDQLVMAFAEQRLHDVAAGVGQCGIEACVHGIGRGQALRVADRQYVVVSGHVQARTLAAAAPGHARPRVAVQDGALLQVPLDFDARGRAFRRRRLVRAAVQGDEAAEPVAQALRVVHAQQVQRFHRALHRGGVDLVGVLRRRQVRVAVAQRLVALAGERVDEVAQ